MIVPFAFLSGFYELPTLLAADFALFIESAAYKYFCACAAISNPFSQYAGVFPEGITNRHARFIFGITIRPAIPALYM